MLKIVFYNLSVELTTDNYNLLEYIKVFLIKYYTQKEQRGFSKYQAGADKVFVGTIKDKPIYLFHVNQFIHLYNYLQQCGHNLTPDVKIDKREYDVISTNFKVRDNWELREHQKPIVEFLLDNPVKSKLVPIQTGAGKCTPLSAKIKVPGGWSYMRNMRVGTTITAWDGTLTKVTGVYPQGIKKVYKITFEDGRSTECSGEHLWKVYSNHTPGYDYWKVINTHEVIKLISTPGSTAHIPLIEHEQNVAIDLPINPYLLGITIAEKCLSENPSKFIPGLYLNSTTREEKIRLLQGLLDVNGYANESKQINFRTTSYTLAKDIQYLVRSIGGIATIHHLVKPADSTESVSNKTKIYEYREEYYTVTIIHKLPSELFNTNKKKEQVGNYQQEDLKLKIESVEYIGDKETQCISVDHPDQLYITDDFIVTHNTFTALYTLAQMNQRFGVVILPTFIPKWIEDIAKIHEAKTSDIMVIQGSKSLRALIELSKTESLDSDYYIFSIRTLQDYITQYEEDPDLCVDLYGCSPIELFPLLGIGTMLIDETHVHYHAIFKILIYTNVKFQIGLSATLMSDDKVVERMHNIVYPDKCVYKGGELERYTDVYAITYTISEHFMKSIRTKNFNSTNYSHTAFEQSILRRSDILQRYIRLIKTTVDDYYIDDYKELDKVIIFVATIALATALTNAMKEFYPKFTIQRYVEEDSYEEMLDGDIIISTPTSAGTALDIPMLRVAIQTVSISSSPTNIQNLGRLRKLSDRDVKFCYLYASNINKQREFHTKRVELFRPRVANIVLRQSTVGV